MDDALIGKGINAGLAYTVRGRRLYGSDLAPPVAHIGHKMAQVGRYGQLAYAGYRVGKKFYDSLKRPRSEDSFSQNEKRMAPVSRRGSQSSQRSRRSSLLSAVMRTSTDGGRRPTYQTIPYSGRSRTLSAPPRLPDRFSPGFNRRGLGRKSYRTAGASMSKSSGKFPKARGKKNLYDYFVTRGVGRVIERGGVIAGGALIPAQSILIGHSTCTISMMHDNIAYAIVKHMATLLKRDIVNFEDFVMVAPSRSEQMVITYITNSFLADVNSVMDITASSTRWEDVKNHWVNLMATSTTTGLKLKKLEYFSKAVATTPGVGRENHLSLNLDLFKVHIYTKSSLKIQNRTVNSTNNDESDDVVNVPLYGKQYEAKQNYFLFGGTYFPTDTVGFAGQTNEGPNNRLLEPPSLAQVKNAHAIASAKLDPGHIKTSGLTYKASFVVNSILRSIFVGGVDTASTATINFGKSRWFCFEKMIQAISTTDVNVMKVAYELDTKFASYATCPKNKVTTNVISLSPL